MGGKNSQLEELGAGIEQQGNPLARGEASFIVLAFNVLSAATFADGFFFGAYLGYQRSHGPHVGFKAGGGWVKVRLQRRRRGWEGRGQTPNDKSGMEAAQRRDYAGTR